MNSRRAQTSKGSKRQKKGSNNTRDKLANNDIKDSESDIQRQEGKDGIFRMTNIETEECTFNKPKPNSSKSETSQKRVVVEKNNRQLVKRSKTKEKAIPIENNYFTLFVENEKMISGQLAATKHKYNTFTVLSSSKLWSFKFDHILKTNLSYLAAGDNVNKGNEPKEEGNTFETYTNYEANRFINQNRNLIYVNMTEDNSEKVPSSIPEFPKQFYHK